MQAPASAYGTSYDGALDLGRLQATHRVCFSERQQLTVDGNTAAAIPFLQWWRSPIMAGFPITPSTKWLEYLAAQVASGRHDVEIEGRRVPTKRIKLLEAEHAVADYLVGAAASCRELIFGTATSSVGLDHMTETLRSAGASGLGNIVLVNACRATANFPLCIEGDPSDALAHRDDGFIQVMCRGRQQIYDTLLQLPAVGMSAEVLTPTMLSYYGIKDSHRSSPLLVEPDEEVNRFLDTQLAASQLATPPGLLAGDTAMGACVTSAWFQGFKIGQKRRMQQALPVLARVAQAFEAAFGRKGIEPFEAYGMDDSPEVALVCMGPDAGTAIHLLGRLREELGTRIGVIVTRLLSPFPSEALAAALASVKAIGVINNAHHHGRGHLTLDIMDALGESGRNVPVEAFFCGLGGADISAASVTLMAKMTCEAAARGKVSRRWHFIHEGIEIEESER